MQKINIGIDFAALNRRQFLKVAAGGLAAAGGTVLPFQAAAQSKLNVGYMKIGDLSPFFLAMEKEFFKGAGLDINLASMVGGAAIMPALASGSINIGWSNVISIYQGHLQGFDFRFIVGAAFASAPIRRSSRPGTWRARRSRSTRCATSCTARPRTGSTRTAVIPAR